MYHKLKIDAGHSKKGTHIFVNEDQAAILIDMGRIEERGHEVNPDEKEVKTAVVVDSDDEDHTDNPDEKGKAGRKPKVTSIQNSLQ